MINLARTRRNARTRRPSGTRHLAALVVIAGALSACGGGDDNDRSPFDAFPGGSSDQGDSLDPLDSLPFNVDVDVELVPLPGQVRFANFISDGTAGIDIDVYWAVNPAAGVKIATIPYGTVGQYLAPQRVTPSLLDEDRASWVVLPAGAEPTLDNMIGGVDEAFDADTRLTVLMAGSPDPSGGYGVLTSVVSEHELSTPPSDSAHVYSWDSPWEMTDGGTFGVVGSTDQCFFDNGEATGGNVGTPALVAAGTSGLALFDANTDCASGAAPAFDSVEGGASYVLIGAAPTADPTQRISLLLRLAAP